MVSVPPQVSKLLDGIRSAERSARIPANCLVPLALAAIFLLVYASQSIMVATPDTADPKVRQVTALKAAMEKLHSEQQEDRAELLRTKEQLAQAHREKKELEVWKAHQDEGAELILLEAARLSAEIGAVWKEALGDRKPRDIAAEVLADKLNENVGDIYKAVEELKALDGGHAAGSSTGASAAPPALFSLTNLIPVRVLALRLRLEQLRVSLTDHEATVRASTEQAKSEAQKAVESCRAEADKVKQAVLECKEQGGGGKDVLEQCNALAARREAVKAGTVSAESALADCTESSLVLILKSAALRRAAARKVARLQQLLQEGSKAAPEAVRAEVEKAAELCKLSAAATTTGGPTQPVNGPRVSGAPAGANPQASCNATGEEMARYLNYTAHGICPDDWALVQRLIFEQGCHSLPRRRCFAPNWKDYLEPLPLPGSLWNSSALMDSNVRWEGQHCGSFECLRSRDGAPADCPDCFDWGAQRGKFEGKARNQMSVEEALMAKNRTLRIGLDVGGGAGSFAALMAERNVTILTTGVDLDVRPGVAGEGHAGGGGVGNGTGVGLGVPYMEAIAMRGLVPLYLPHTARLPFFDGTLDVIHTSSSVDGMPYSDFEDAMFDWDRVLRPGGVIWFSQFHSQVRAMPPYMEIVDMFKYKYLHRTITPSVQPDGLHVYVNFLIEKPRERDVTQPPPEPFER